MSVSARPGTPTAVGRAFKQAREFDRAKISARAGLVAALPVAAMLSLGLGVGNATDAVTMGVGAMLVGVVWRAGDGPLTPPIGTMAAATAALTLCTLVGTLTGRWSWLHLGVLAIVCLTAGLVTALGRRGISPGNQAIIAFVVFGRFPENFANACGLAGLVLAGGAAQTLFAAFVGLPVAWRRERDALAVAYRRLAELSGSIDASLVPSADALEQADNVLSAPALFADHDRVALNGLVEEGRRIRLELAVLTSALHQAGREQPELYDSTREQVGAVLARLTPVLKQSVAAIEGSKSSREWLRAEAAQLSSWGSDREPLPQPLVDDRVSALIGQVTAAARLAAALSTPGRLGRPTLGNRGLAARIRYRFGADLEQIRANASFNAAPGRHAVRLAVVVAGVELLTQRVALPRGYWAVVAAAMVLRPGFGATFTRGAERVLGTCLGVLLASLIAVFIDPSGWGIVAVVATLAYLTYAVFPASFAAGTALLTAVIVFLLHAVVLDTVTTAFDRGLDTVIGGAIGLVAYALWPTWSAHSTGPLLSRLIDAQRDYLDTVFDALLLGVSADANAIRARARRARIAFTDCQAALSLARNEPRRGDLDPQAAAATLSALRRVVYSVHALRVDLTASEAQRPHPQLTPLRDGVNSALSTISQTLREGEQPAPAQETMPSLRTLYRQTKWATGDDQLRPVLDELVDAINTAAAGAGL